MVYYTVNVRFPLPKITAHVKLVNPSARPRVRSSTERGHSGGAALPAAAGADARSWLSICSLDPVRPPQRSPPQDSHGNFLHPQTCLAGC